MDSLKRQMEALQSNSPGTGIGETTPANTPAWAAALDKEQSPPALASLPFERLQISLLHYEKSLHRM